MGIIHDSIYKWKHEFMKTHLDFWYIIIIPVTVGVYNNTCMDDIANYEQVNIHYQSIFNEYLKFKLNYLYVHLHSITRSGTC